MSAVATPPAMFAPARLWTSRTPPRPRIEATIAAVVVFPFVALMIELPPGRRADSVADRVRLHAQQQPAGQRRAAAAGAPGQHADAAGGGDLEAEQRHGARTRRALGTARIVAGRHPDRVPVGVDAERAPGVDVDLAGLHELDGGVAQVGAAEHARQAAQEPPLREVAVGDDLDEAVGDVRVRREVHPAAVDAGVARGDGVAVEPARLAAVDGELQRDRLPRRQRAQRRVQVDGLAVRRVVAFAMSCTSVSIRSSRCRGTSGRRPPPRRRCASSPRARIAHASTGVERDAQLAGEVVAAAPGQQAERALASAQGVRDRAGEAVAAVAHRDVTGLDRAAGERLRVLDAGRLLDRELDAVAAQRLLDGRQLRQRPATAGVRVHDEAQATRHGRAG